MRPARKFSSLVLAISFAICVFGGQTTHAVAQAQTASRESALTPIQREIERQRQRLASTEVEDRRDALIRLKNLNRVEASRIAVVGLTDAVPVVRATAAHAIGHLPSEEDAALLVPLLQDRVEFVRQEAAYALGETRSRSAVQPLMSALLSDKKDSVRNAAAVALGWIGDESAVVSLSQVLAGNVGTQSVTTGKKKKRKAKSRENEFLLRAAAHSLGQIRSRAGVPALVAALSNEENYGDVRREAAIALGLIGDKSANPALQTALGSSDPYLSRSAYDSLRKISNSKN